jgi:lysyl-tRNA synthetase class 2
VSTPFIEENDQTRARREHLDELRRLVGNVYPNKFERSRVTGREDTVTAINQKFKPLEPKAPEGERPAPEELERVNAELNKTEVRVSGRIATPPRVMGKAAFVHLSDGRERLQIYVRKADVKGIRNDDGSPIEEGWEMFNLLDHGDFIGVAGYLFVTKTGELSVHVRELQFLAKALLPMPDKMHGISDPEIRQRQRYADLIAGSLKVEREEGELTPREVFERRTKLITEMRRFLDDHGYIEVETPMLTPLATGAAAKPFKTHHNALDIDLYARIAPELYLKRLLVGGFEKVYELNRNFRNEGIGYRWNPEFTMLEFYCAYMDVNGMMDFCEEMLRTVVIRVTGRTQFKIARRPALFAPPKVQIHPVGIDERGAMDISGTEVDFASFKRRKMRDLILEAFLERFELSEEDVTIESGKADHWLDNPQNVVLLYDFVKKHQVYFNKAENSLYKEGILGEDIDDDNTDIINKQAWKDAKMNFSTHQSELNNEDVGGMILQLFESLVELRLRQKKNPILVTDFPKSVSPLSKASPSDPVTAERFELYIAGMEVANGFSELNDPDEQRERFLEQMQQRERGDEEAMVLDEDYIRALSYGMPPAAGIGIGIDRLTMILTGKRSIRDVILFPHMRPERKAEAKTEDTQEQDDTA